MFCSRCEREIFSSTSANQNKNNYSRYFRSSDKKKKCSENYLTLKPRKSIPKTTRSTRSTKKTPLFHEIFSATLQEKPKYDPPKKTLDEFLDGPD